MTKILGREDFLSGESLKRELVPVPELNGEIWMRDIGASGTLAFNERIQKIINNGEKEVTPDNTFELMALAFSLSACDEDSNLLYTEEDIHNLVGKNNAAMLTKLGAKALEISGLKSKVAGELASEVSANLPNAPTNSLSESLRKSSRKRAKKS